MLVVAVLAALAVGLVLQNRQGRIRASSAQAPHADAAGTPDPRPSALADAGVEAVRAPSPSGPVVLHFSADWCGPCAAVRRVVGQVLTTFDDAPHPPVEWEVDIDEHPALAKEFGVLSLPTTFVLDGDLAERFRIAGVPKAGELRAALEPFTQARGSASGNNG
ncbi:thioredoxin family protein [Rhodococcus sp. HNM0569]|nr:thioredoxin family protein [Rhodococcus sp. HNM0569]